MPLYVMLSRPNTEGLHHLRKNPDRLNEVQREIEALDCKVVHRLALPGTLSFLTVVEVPNNLGAFRMAVERQSSGRVHTDVFPAIDLELFVRHFGYEPAEALVAATKLGGELMDMAHELGQLKPGFLADLLLVDGDPTRDIAILQDKQRLLAIMKDGRFHKAPAPSTLKTAHP